MYIHMYIHYIYVCKCMHVCLDREEGGRLGQVERPRPEGHCQDV